MIAIIDYGAGNLASIRNMLKKINVQSEFVENPDRLLSYRGVVLPGVGAFDFGMRNLNNSGFVGALREAALLNFPILGICLGMQMLTLGSEEGEMEGIGLIDAFCYRFKNNYGSERYRVPHMGWNFLERRRDDQILEGLDEKSKFYFVHSYFVKCNDFHDVLTTTKYGEDFVSTFKRNNIIGAQFHPEKSHRFGKQFFCNFARLCHDKA